MNWESLIQPQINVDRELPPLTGISALNPDTPVKPGTVVVKPIVTKDPLFNKPIKLGGKNNKPDGKPEPK